MSNLTCKSRWTSRERMLEPYSVCLTRQGFLPSTRYSEPVALPGQATKAH